MSDCCNAKSHPSARRIALVGNPNCGKTTLFNALTGATQHVGNWPGVTVERMSGHFIEGEMTVEVVDLPGTYSLTILSDHAAIDACIACDFILAEQADLVVNVVDASNLDRHLYLTTQLLTMGLPVLLAVNMMDVAKARGLQIDCQALSTALGCPVVALQANKAGGLRELKQAMVRYQPPAITPLQLPYATAVVEAMAQLESKAALGIRLLEDEAQARQQVSTGVLAQVAALQADIRARHDEDADILIADARYQFIQQVVQRCVRRVQEATVTWTARIDKIVLHRLLGVPIFLGIMYLLFVFAINIGGYFQTYFDQVSQAVLVDGLGMLLANWHAPVWLTVILANGIGKGLNTVVTFVPVIGAMFLFLAALEDSGYMARAAFVVDRFMCALGLPGKAFVPMIVGFGCNVPAVMAARTLEHQRDRILTIMMTPFMSCGARLAIYAVFAAAFFPHGGQNMVFLLYVIGIVMAIFTGFLLQRTLLRGETAALMMELPAYHLPQVPTLLRHAWQRLKGFVFRAGQLIVPICMVIGVLNTFNTDGTLNQGAGDVHSVLSMVGQWMTPLFAPMGIQPDNWPATVGLVTGVLAKEVVVGTLNTLYTEMGAYGSMVQQFDGKIGAFAYLLFVLLYFPCVSTMAVMLREVHRGWTVFSAVWMIGAAYGLSVIFYQAATWSRHPMASLAWITGMVAIFVLTVGVIRWVADRPPKLLGVMA